MKTIKIIYPLFVALTVTLSSSWAQDNEAIKKDLALMQGAWSMVSGSADGQAMPAQMVQQMKRVCQGDELTITMNGQPYFKAKITIDPSKKPKTINYQMTEGFAKGKKQLGIYEIEGETIKSCFAKPDAERPTEFASTAGDGRTLTVWKRRPPVTPRQMRILQ